MRHFVLIIVAFALCAAPAHAATPDGKTVVGLIDTGINAGHRAFDSDQVVAWWDFTRGELPEAGQTWYSSRAPYDDEGHGTATAAMVAGRKVHPLQSPSLAPGTKLAIAKVQGADGALGDLAPAIRWAATTARADVINISIGSIVPVPEGWAVYEAYTAIEEARRDGVLVTVSNGNGTANLGLVPGDGATKNYSGSRNVLAVGASGTDGLRVSYQPEVAANIDVFAPVHDKPVGVAATSGTSFAAPFVAGLAAAVIADRCAAGSPVSVSRLETLIKHSATDTDMPPVTEGYGEITEQTLAVALEHARAGTLPGRPDPDVSGLYVERVAGGARDVNSAAVPALPEDEPKPRACS